MSDLPAFLADTWLSLAAALGAVIVLRVLPALMAQDGLRARMRFVLGLSALLMLVRIGHAAGAGWLFSALTHASAALMPLAALLLSEGFLRRHAPPWLKLFCAGGGGVMCLIGLIQFEAFEPLRIGGLLALQLIGLLGVAGFVITRDRSSLAADENAGIDRMALTFLLILPLVATDFLRGDAGDIPVRMGGLAILALCWLALSQARSGLTRRQIVLGFVAALAMSGALTLVISGFATLESRAAVQTGASILAGILLLAIAQSAIALRIEDQQMIALNAIAAPRGRGAEAALRFVREAAGAPEAVLVETVHDLDEAALHRAFAEAPVQDDSNAGESAAWLLDRMGASHLLALSSQPLRLIALDRPAIARADPSGAALNAIQKVAVDIMGAAHA